MLRACFLAVTLVITTLPAMAGEMTAAEARRFVIGKIFYYTCFEGTRGQGRVYADGSVAGSIQIRGEGRVHFAALPAGTLQVKGEAVCASVRGLPIHPCFDLDRTSNESFRGSISGLSFAYCNFTRRHERAHVVHQRHFPIHRASPVELRPSLTADAE